MATHNALYTFDAERVAWLETRMWEAYYARQDMRLFVLLVRTVASQFGVAKAEAVRVALMLTRPAMAFARTVPRYDDTDAFAPTGDPQEYAAVLPDLEAAYERIRAINGAAFDPARVAHAELQWWIVHRHPTAYGQDALTEAIAALYAALYVTDIERVREAGRLRAEACLVSDAGRMTTRQVRGTSYWAEVHDLLRQSYGSLRAAIDGLAPATTTEATPPPATSGANHYHFVTAWTVQAPIELTYETLADARSYLDWWPEVYLGVETEPGRGVAHLHTKGALPYQLHWTTTAVAVEPPTRLVSRGSGDFDGVAQWLLHDLGDGRTEVTLDWELHAEKPLLKLLSPIAKPLFAWNHDWAMQRAIRGLEPYLRARLAARTGALA